MQIRDRRTRLRITVSVVLLLSITLITLDARDVAVVESVKSSMGDGLTGGDGALGALTRPFRNMWHGVQSYDRLKDENGKLREEMARQKNAGRDDQMAAPANRPCSTCSACSTAPTPAPTGWRGAT